MKIGNFFTRKISSKLIALSLGLSVIPVIILGFLSYNTTKKALENSISERLVAVAYSRAHHIENLLESSRDLVKSVASLKIIKDNLQNMENGTEVEKSKNILEDELNDLKHNSVSFYRIKILNKKGIIVASTKEIVNEVGADRSERDYFKGGLTGVFISEPYKSSTDNNEQVVYSAPIFSSSSNQVIGVIAFHQALDAAVNCPDNPDEGISLNDITLNNAGMGANGINYLVNKERKVFTHSNDEKAIFMNKEIPLPVFENADVSTPIIIPYRNYRDMSVIGKSVPIPGTSWVLVLEFSSDEAFSSVDMLRNEMILLTLVIILVVSILGYFISKAFARPIVSLTEVARAMALGDLGRTFNVSQQDEIGQLANSFKAVQAGMQEKAQRAVEIAKGDLTGEITLLSDKDTMGMAFKTMVERLRHQLNEIGEGVNVLASSTAEISAAVSQLASTSAETASAVGETTSTVEEVKQTTELSNSKAKMVSESAVRSADIAREGNKAIINTTDGMSRIKKQMESIAGMVIKLNEQSQTIGEITATVNELAEQSNLLAVNAAIEAAKAGEQGKGFTVVAQEIKKLAGRSKEATAEVRNILRDIQKSISSAVMATEEGGRVVEEGLKLTSVSGDTIKALSESIATAANAAIQIAASSQQQLEGMDQVVAAMENIREASMQSAASTQQSADSVTELQKLGEKLKVLMNQYKF